MHQRSHDAAHVHLISTAVPLAIVLHPQPAEREREKETQTQDGSEGKGDEQVETDWEHVGGGEEHGTKGGR